MKICEQIACPLIVTDLLVHVVYCEQICENLGLLYKVLSQNNIFKKKTNLICVLKYCPN